MSNKLYIFAALCFLIFSAGTSSAQCPFNRYVTEIFPSVQKDSVIYSTPYGLKMDIYQPVGDTIPKRPLIILAHGGSFVSGARNDDSTVVWLCRNFAKRGYVTASIDYRLGNIINMISPDSTYAINEVIKAMSDGKAAIRYFSKDSATMATYRIDTNNIFIGGNSAGAVLYMHVGYLDSVGEAPSYIASALAANGGFEGNSGNPGHTPRAKAVINLAGALNMTSFVGPNNLPSVNAQGDADLVVPFYCGQPNIGVPVHVTLCGLGSLEPAYAAHGIYHMSKVFPGDSHVPWASDAAKFFTVDSLITQFLYSVVCTTIAGVDQVNSNIETTIFPNPASEMVNIRSSEFVNEIIVFDNTGRVVINMGNINSANVELNTARLTPGIYFVKIKYNNGNNAPVVKRVVIQ